MSRLTCLCRRVQKCTGHQSGGPGDEATPTPIMLCTLTPLCCTLTPQPSSCCTLTPSCCTLPDPHHVAPCTLTPHSDTCRLLSYKPKGCKVSLELMAMDVETLNHSEYLNDKIINFYLRSVRSPPAWNLVRHHHALYHVYNGRGLKDGFIFCQAIS